MKKSSKKIILASVLAVMLVFALTACGNDTPAPAPAEPEAPAVDIIPAVAGLPYATATFTPGVYTAEADSFGDYPLVVEVHFSENQITNIAVVSHSDSKYGSGWFLRAYPGVPDQIFVRQSTQDIDAFTGATATRDAIIEAVEDTIRQAGANPADLEPQYITAPLPGDKFIPGYHEITVPASTMDIYGNPLPADYVPGAENPEVMRMLYHHYIDMLLRVSFGRNELHLHTGGQRGLGQGAYGHGSTVAVDEVQGGTWGSFWFRQVAHHQINDRQSTHVDIHTGATMSASGIVWGVNQAIIAAGGDPAAITPRTYPLTQITRNPSNPDARFLIPGYYTVTTEGFGGEMNVTVTVDRSNIRRIVINEHNESGGHWDRVWPELRDLIFESQTTNISLDSFAGATISANAVVEAVREALAAAGETNPANW